MKAFNHLLLTVFALSLFMNTGFAQDSEKGNLYLTKVNTISPEHRQEYEEWEKQFKKIADATKAPNYSALSSQGEIRFVSLIGKEMSEYPALINKWKAWGEANPEIGKLREKYIHTLKSSYYEIWRYAPDLRYTPTKRRGKGEYTYRKYTKNYIKPGKVEAFKSVIYEYIEEYKKLEVPFSVFCYWNVMGAEGPCVLIRVNFLDRLDWAKSDNALGALLKDNEKIKELRSKLLSTLRDSESYEAFYKKEFSHRNDSN